MTPTPPASCTARLLLTRAFTPRSQTTILPATFAGSSTGTPALSMAAKQSCTAVGLAPANPAAVASISGAVGTTDASDGPLTVVPLPKVTTAVASRLIAPAATVVRHGAGCATVPAVGPLLPAAA